MAQVNPSPTEEEVINDNPSQTEEVIINNPSPIGEIINSSPFQKTQGAVSTYDYVQDDTLYINEKMKTVMVSSGEQLNSLYDLNMEQLYLPGTIAYTPGFTNMWQLSATGKWVSMLSGGNSGSGGSDNSMDNDTKKYVEYFVKTVTREITEINDDQGLITSIGANAFPGCYSLTTVSFPEATSIGDNAFPSCSSLTTVSFPEVNRIGSAAFSSDSSLTTVSFPKVTSIGNGAFYGCSGLTTVSFPNVTSIDDSAFVNCNNMTDLYLPNAESTYTHRRNWFSSGMKVTVHYNTSFDENGNPII